MTKKNASQSHETPDAAQSAAEAPSAPVGPIGEKVSFVIGSIVDLGTTLAGTGIGYVRQTIENSARALDRTARLLAGYQEKITTRSAARPGA